MSEVDLAKGVSQQGSCSRVAVVEVSYLRLARPVAHAQGGTPQANRSADPDWATDLTDRSVT